MDSKDLFCSSSLSSLPSQQPRSSTRLAPLCCNTAMTAPKRCSCKLRRYAMPAFSAFQQLFDLVIADPVMLIVIQHGDQHIEMRQKFAQTAGCFQHDGEVGTHSPLRMRLVEHVRSDRNGIAQGFEETPEPAFTAVTSGYYSDPGL